MKVLFVKLLVYTVFSQIPTYKATFFGQNRILYIQDALY